MARSFLADISPIRESREFRLFYFGEALSSLGRQLTLVAAPIQVYALTGSTLMVGLLGLAQFPAVMAGSTIGGVLSDALDRRKVLIGSESILALVSVGLALNAMAENQLVSVIFVLTALQALFFAIDAPARTSAIPRLVSPSLIPAAYALQILRSQTAKAIGPIIAGVLIFNFSLAATYWIDAAAFTIAIASVFAMAPLPAAEGGTRPGLKSIREGFKFLKDKKAIQGALLIDVNATVFGLPRALFPEMGVTIFGGTAATVGLLYSAPGIGALIAVATSGWIGKVSKAGRATTVAVVIWGLAIMGFGFSKTIALGLTFLALAGAADAISSVFRATIVQLTTPDHLRGRLSGVKIAVVAGGPRLGDIEAGAVATGFGPAFAAWSGGLASSIGALIIAKALPAFYKWETPAEGEISDG